MKTGRGKQFGSDTHLEIFGLNINIKMRGQTDKQNFTVPNSLPSKWDSYTNR